MIVLNLGSGLRDIRALYPDDEVITLDMDARLEPDIVCELGVEHIPLPSDSVDLAHAIHVLEHIGKQGETASWFAFWEDLYRVLKPGGVLLFESPLYNSIWAWADPSHTRALSPFSFVYFSQETYRVKNTSVSPFRIQCDFSGNQFEVIGATEQEKQFEKFTHFRGELHAVKPLKPWWEDVELLGLGDEIHQEAAHSA